MKKSISLLIILFVAIVGKAQRLITSLNANWEFVSEKNINDTARVNLPHTWNADDAFLAGGNYFRGKGFYSKTFFVPEKWNGQQLFVRFEGANQVTELFVNDTKVGEHIGGYTGFVFNITPYLSFGCNNQLKVVCDNSYNENIAPLSADFTFYGGIYRDVNLIHTQSLHVEVENNANGNVQVKTPVVNEKEAQVEVKFNLKNSSEQKAKTEVRLTVYDANNNVIANQSQKIIVDQLSKAPVTLNFNINNPQLWSPESPVLYFTKIEVIDTKTKQVTDEVTTHFGCRWFSIDASKGFFLNGKKYRLMGVNRHQDFKGLGNALPNEVHEHDMKMVKEMGSNFIRIAHYPQDPDIYDWCDKLGIIAWSEIPIVNQVTNSDAFYNNCMQMQREHVLQMMNHPCVVMWGYMNEVFLRPPFNSSTTKEEKDTYYQGSVKLAKQINDLTKQLDSARLTVMALHGSQIYNETGIADVPDVIGWNLYMGWYGGQLDQLGDFLDNEHKNHPLRPIIISEYGPGADVRNQTYDPKPWDFSEAYQLKNHMSYVDQVFERDFVIGMAAWNYADFASAGRVDAIPNLNQKGLLNFDRTTKDVYHYYQARLFETPFVYVAGKNFETQFLDEDTEGKAYLPVTVFSNAGEVKIRLDGENVASLEVQNGVATTSLWVDEGLHTVEAEISGASHIRTFNIMLTNNFIERLPLQPLCVNVGSRCNFTDDVTGEIWIAEREYQPGSWGYVGGEVYQKSKSRFQGTDQDIQGTGNDPLYQTMREGLQAYFFDVPAGTYKVTLLMTEPNAKNAPKLVYDIGNVETRNDAEGRTFSVFANGREVFRQLNLATEYGVNTAVELAFEITTSKNIEIKFESDNGKAILSAIKLEHK